MQEYEKILADKSIRITPMRQLLLTFFLQENRSFGLLELEIAFPKSDRITIYRTLKTFEENGIVHRINHGAGEAKFALCKEHCSTEQHLDQHPHFHCLKCGQIQCMETLTLLPPDLPPGYTYTSASMHLKGLCPSCQPE